MVGNVRNFSARCPCIFSGSCARLAFNANAVLFDQCSRGGDPPEGLGSVLGEQRAEASRCRANCQALLRNLVPCINWVSPLPKEAKFLNELGALHFF